MKRTTVISVRGRDRLALLADPDFVYVGRSVWRAGWDRASFWGNPFKVRKHSDPGEAVARYRRQIEKALSLNLAHAPWPPTLEYAYTTAVQSELPKLRGKILGCWCCDWDGTGEPSKPCHAVLLARLADGLPGRPTRAEGGPP